ncbi:putative immunity protein [Haloferax namakaokahaiae]|uniref:Immunity protein n=1 Tax=Haloferax namakaokahaiae TaxID=1748331 RepID=A0ABD5ZGU5_9EURY
MEFAIWWEMGPEWNGDNSLDDERHRALALWAADCAEHVLQFFEGERPDDDRPRDAIEATRAWHRGEVAVGETRAYALAAQAAARDAGTTAASEVARAAEHAVGAAEVDRHAKAAANYAIKAAVAANPRDERAAETEANWQMGQLPSDLRAVVFLEERAK